MTMDVHSHVDAVLKYAQRLQALMDEQLDKMAGESFTATDEAETVEVTLNGHHRLVDVFIEDGLLSLDPPTDLGYRCRVVLILVVGMWT